MIDFKSVEAVLSIAGMLFGGLALVISWLTRGSKANAEKIKDLEETKIKALEASHEEQDERIRVLETRLSNLPTKDDFHALDLKLTNLNGNIEALSAQLGAVDYLTKSMDAHLRTKGGSS